MHELFHASPVHPPTRDPMLLVDAAELRRALLFDLGDVSPLPPRKLMRLQQVFVSHAHMDHFAGFDALLRTVLGRKRLLQLYGGPEFIEQVEHKLRAYTWNVVANYAVPLELQVHALQPDGGGRCAGFRSDEGFARGAQRPWSAEQGVLLDDAWLRVRAAFVDHGTPCLAFVFEPRALPRIDAAAVRAMGLRTGPWLRRLRQALLHGEPDCTLIDVAREGGDAARHDLRSVGELRLLARGSAPPRRLGFVTDLRYTEANVRSLCALMPAVDVLYIECVFLERDAAHARRKNHLTARQAGEIARRLGAGAVVPLHVSPRYQHCQAQLFDEMLSAWRGVAA